MASVALRSLAPLGPLGAHLGVLCDPRMGIVNDVAEIPIEPGSPRFFHFAARACNTQAFVAQRNFYQTGGAAVTREIALAKAVGEAVERYCGAIYDRETLPLASAAAASFACVDPGQFALYSAAQYAEPGFPWVPFTRETMIRWTPATDLLSGDIVHVPAAFVWIPYSFVRGSSDAPIGQPISTGLACHGSRPRAILGGLYEVVERDCFTIAWQAGIAPPRIRAETIPDAAYDMVRRFEETGDRVILLDITTDNGIPCILSVLLSDAPERPARVFAASADLDPARALAKAVEELAHTRRYAQQIRRHLPPVSDQNDWEDIVTQMDHLNFAADPANSAVIDSLLGSNERRSFADYASLATNPDDDVITAASRIEDTGHRAYAADLTSADMAMLGLHVWRVIVPGYHPLFMGYRIRALGGTRLFTVPQRLGHPGVAPGQDRGVPHPYP
ncbi:YcaO-like family protein [Sphingomonas sp. 28-63-12]|uniref:YcaO-like family protein n=1 Tax=Sphingomonas sp. 28-63-12 TaxID=1970434 RepID=UPI000BD83CC5|nr:MAG: hypothetical protein B7Y47_11995 [Sphingomonas sp. 28-63-12]